MQGEGTPKVQDSKKSKKLGQPHRHNSAQGKFTPEGEEKQRSSKKSSPQAYQGAQLKGTQEICRKTVRACIKTEKLTKREAKVLKVKKAADRHYRGSSPLGFEQVAVPL